MEKFYEIAVGAGDSKKYNLYNGLFVASIILAFFVFIMINNILGIFIAIVFVLPMFLIKRVSYIEYDYEFNSGELTVSAVYEKRRRKKIVDVALDRVEVIAPANSVELDRFKSIKSKKLYNDIADGRSIYSIVIKKQEKLMCYDVTLDKQMIDLCFISNPQNVKRY